MSRPHSTRLVLGARIAPLSRFILLLSCFLVPALVAPLETTSPAPTVALTFDDGPHPESTRLLSRVLARYQVPATFFVVGRVGALHTDLLRNLIASGHELANHTWSHRDIRRLTPRQIRWELDHTRELIAGVTGHETYLFRAPGCTDRYLRERFQVPPGYQLVLWDVHSLDQEGHSSTEIAERVLSRVKDGDVILMHNGLTSTRKALETIIPALKAKGYKFVTVSKILMSRARSPQYAQRPVALRGEIWTK